ncbi:hypothetical protein O3M35_006810 [Rhynocoris fuscipes]|uniref:Uncharacterized protein n=1 Tax=Rhynocoris fuscipes TaxID=488301 RepID=A0AAW1DMF2_9HEMI
MEVSQQKSPTSKCKSLVLNDEAAKILLEAVDLPEKMRNLLEKNVDMDAHECSDVKDMLKELLDFLKETTKSILETSDEDDKEKSLKIIKSIVSLLKLLVEKKVYSETLIFETLINALSYILTFKEFDFSTQNQVSQLCEKYLEIVGYGTNEYVDMAVCTLNFLLEFTLGKIEGKSVSNADIKRVWNMKAFITILKMNNPLTEKTQNLLLESVTSLTYLQSREGRLHIASIFSKELSLVKSIHTTIKNKLPELNKKQAGLYGDVYFNAWNMAKADVEKEIERCIQDLMELCFTLNRTGLEMGKAGSRVFEILSSLHSLRRLHKFSNTITELYTPFIWRYLKSDLPLERCNAAKIFLDVFPLEKPKGGIVINSQYREKQLNEMRDLLLDECHYVRIIAIKGFCYHLTYSLDCLTVSDVKELLGIITQKLANDASSYQVRVAVFDGLAFMLNEPRSAKLMLTFLPHMYLHIHDVHEKVRAAFVRILLKVRESSEELTMNYFNIVPLKHLTARLVEDHDMVGHLLAKLLMSDIYTPGQTVDVTMRRIRKLIKVHPLALKKLFKYSEQILTVKDAYSLIITIIGSLRKELKNRVEERDNPENRSSAQRSSTVSRKKSKKVLGDISNSYTSSSKEGESENVGSNSDQEEEETGLIGDRQTVASLISSAATLYAKFSDQIIANDEYCSNVEDLSIAFIPQFLLHFKNTVVYYAVINYASLIPINKLAPVSTVAGACMSELKEVSEETPVDVLQCLTHSLCAWNRGHEIIELAMEWLNYAFRSQDLSYSAVPIDKRTRRTGRVRFKPEVGKPLLALKLLDVTLDDIWNEKRLLNKSYTTLLEFYKFLSRIEILLEKRFSRNCPFDEVSDELLHGCYKRYLLLPYQLHRADEDKKSENNTVSTAEPIKAYQDLTRHLEWASKHLIGNIPVKDEDSEIEEKPLVIKCIIELLQTAYIIIDLNLVNQVFAKNISLFVLNILDTVWNAYFIEGSIEIIKALSKYAEAFTMKDEWNLYKTVLPALLSKVLETFALVKFTKDNKLTYFQHFEQIKSSLFTCLIKIQNYFGKDSKQFKEVYNFYVFSCVEMVANEINEGNCVMGQFKLDDHPLMVSVIMKYLVNKRSLSPYLLSSLNEQITINKDEGIHLLACLLLLHTLAFGPKHIINADEFSVCLQNAYTNLNYFNDSNKTNINRSENTTFTLDSEGIDIFQEGNKYIDGICKRVHCARPITE